MDRRPSRESTHPTGSSRFELVRRFAAPEVEVPVALREHVWALSRSGSLLIALSDMRTPVIIALRELDTGQCHSGRRDRP